MLVPQKSRFIYNWSKDPIFLFADTDLVVA
jgi:hypothetical protein